MVIPKLLLNFANETQCCENMEIMERMPFTSQKKIFEKLAEFADKRCLSQEEKEKYDASFDQADDYFSVIDSWYDEGKLSSSLKIAKSLLHSGMSLEDVAHHTGLSLEQLKKFDKQ